MISVADAFCHETTSKLVLLINIPGRWDKDNKWIKEGFAPPIHFKATPLPMKDISGAHGEHMEPDRYGERYPAAMMFWSRMEMPINSIVVHNDIPYKVVRKGDYNTAGYWAAAGYRENVYDLKGDMSITIGSDVTPIIRDPDYLKGITIFIKSRSISLIRLLESPRYGK